MKQSLQLRVSQHLALTPQLQQSIRLLQLSTLELHQELEQMLSDNPLLERTDDPLDHAIRLLADGAIGAVGTTPQGAGDDANPPPAPESDTPYEAPSEAPADNTEPTNGETEWSFDDVARTTKAPEDDDARPQLEAAHCTLREHLQEQMRVTVREVRDRALLELVIDALDDNGYLDESLEDIHARMPEELEIELEELSIALKLLQSFDPAGVGARNASECLALQIRRFPHIPMVTRRMALTIVENYLTWMRF